MWQDMMLLFGHSWGANQIVVEMSQPNGVVLSFVLIIFLLGYVNWNQALIQFLTMSLHLISFEAFVWAHIKVMMEKMASTVFISD